VAGPHLPCQDRGGLSPMQPQASSLNPSVIVAIVALVVTWYFYQIASRKWEWLRYKLKSLLVSEIAFIGSAYVLSQKRLPGAEVLVFSLIFGFGCGFLFVKAPRSSRRIPKRIREQVIARTLPEKD